MEDLIIYQSKYGATREYAEWLGEALKTEPVPAVSLKPEQLVYANRVIIGTSVYMGRMLMRNWIAHNQGYLRDKDVYLFVVCGTPASEVEKLEKIVKDNIPAQIRNVFRIFFLPGRVMLDKLSWLDRLLIRIASRAKKRSGAGETLQVGIDYVRKENLATILGTLDRIPVTPRPRVSAGNPHLM
ncbi:MAG TPA: flavodoxin domain-containing protein [Puia sp.]|nr:flavodoxin domain-containing protein [Puia sp.]